MDQVTEEFRIARVFCGDNDKPGGLSCQGCPFHNRPKDCEEVRTEKKTFEMIGKAFNLTELYGTGPQ